MNCPECNKSLLEQHMKGIDVDVCSSCGGVWFDAGEIESYGSQRGNVPGKSPSTPPSFDPIMELAPLPCPRCTSDSLQTGTIAEHIFHRCSSCFGVYLNKKELEAIAKSPMRVHFEGAAKALPEAAWYAPEAILEIAEGALDIIAGVFDGL